MNPVSFVPQQLRYQILKEQQGYPWTQATATGIVAIIDISGYSKLSSHLQQVLGSDSGAKIKELLNPPIEVIIREVHKSGGSVVKFAGDAVIAFWCHDTESEELTRRMIMSSFLCCINLMLYFRDFSISFGESLSSPAPDRRVLLVPPGSTPLERSSSHQHSPAVSQPLKIHIGLGFGETHQIHLGCSSEDEPTTTSTPWSRSEFFIAGDSLAQSGAFLGIGKEGDFVLNELCWSTIRHVLPKYNFPTIKRVISTIPTAGTSAHGQIEAILIHDTLELYPLSQHIKESLGKFDTTRLDTGSELQPRILISNYKNQLARILPYMDEALHHAISTAKCLELGSTTTQLTQPLQFAEQLQLQVQDILSNYDQTRSVCILFIQFQKFTATSVYEPENLETMQTIMTLLVKSAKKYQGCLRQFNCDDKALTALLVWGLQGLAHEKAECEYALPAAFEIASKLDQIFGTSGSGSESAFSIGITSGSVFTGVVGNSSRADGTVLGVAVNNAARIMCLDICKGTIVVDKETFDNAKELFEFDDGIPEVVLKGIPHPVKVFKPLLQKDRDHKVKTAVKGSIGGRDVEMEQILRIHQEWMQNQKGRLLITGRSGAGKSTLMHFLLSLMEKDPRVIVCTGKGQEHHQNTMLFCYSQMIKDLLVAVRDRNYELHRIYRRDSNASQRPHDIVRQCSSSETGSSDSLLRNDPTLHEFITSTFPVSTWDVWATIPGLMRQPSGSKAIVTDLMGKMSALLSRMLETLAKSGSKVCIVVDDIQWSDSYSLELTLRLLFSCPSTFFLITSRPREEFKPSMQPEFRKIADAPNVTHMQLQPLDLRGIEAVIRGSWKKKHADTFHVDPSLVSFVLDQSQGNSLIAVSVLNMLEEDGHLKLENNVLRLIMSKSIRRKSGGNNSVVIAQFDKLSPDMKSILRIAAVAGQSFNINEVRDVLNKSQFGSDISNEKILEIIESSDPYQFIKRVPENEEMRMFSHVLIQQGILSAMIPAKRMAVHNLFADYYEETLCAGNYETHLESLLFHLFKVPGQEERKQTHTYAAFIDSAESFRYKEAFEYLEILNSFENRIEFAKTLIEKARNKRLLAQLHLENRDWAKAIDVAFEGLVILGFNWPNSLLKTILAIAETKMVLERLMKSDELQQRQISLKYLTRCFPVAFQELTGQYHGGRGKVHIESQVQGLQELDEKVEEIVLLFEFTVVPLVAIRPDLNAVLFSCMLAIFCHLAPKDKTVRLSLSWIRLTVAFNTVSLKKLSKAFEALSLQLLEGSRFSYEDANLSSYATELYARIYGSRGLSQWFHLKLPLAARNSRVQNRLADEIGIGFHTKAYYNRWISHMLPLIYGDFGEYFGYVQEDATYFEYRPGQEYDVANLQTLKSYYHVVRHESQEARECVSLGLKGVRTKHGETDENLLRSFHNEVFLFAVFLYFLRTESSKDKRALWLASCSKSCKEMLRTCRNPKIGIKNYYRSAWILLIPALIDCMILPKRGIGCEVLLPDVANLIRELGKSVSRFLTKDPLQKYLQHMQRSLRELQKGHAAKFFKRASRAIQVTRGTGFVERFHRHWEFQVQARMFEVEIIHGLRSTSDPASHAERTRLKQFFEENGNVWEVCKLSEWKADIVTSYGEKKKRQQMSSSPSSLKRKHRQSTEEVDQTQSFESEFADDDDGWNDSDSTEDWDMTLLKRTPTAVIRLPISTTDFESGQDADVTLTGSPLSAPFSSNPSKSTTKTESTSSSIQHQVLNRISPKASPLEESSRNRSSSSVYVPSLIRPNTASKRLKLSILPKEDVLKLPPMAGLLKRIELFQFMCHEWLVFDFSPNINFIVGGKSAILTALIVCLGGSAKLTDRANAMDKLIMTDKSAAEIKLLIHNKGPDAFRPEVYGDTIIIKRKIVQAGAGSCSYVVQDSCEKVVATKRDEIDAICDYFNINVTNPLSVLTQDRARNFLTGSSPEHMYKCMKKNRELERNIDEMKSNLAWALVRDATM
ncbi:Structural maintenance of chromosomes protein 6, partial [Chytriomyces hyalinus]